MIFLIGTIFIAQIIILVNIIQWAISIDNKIRVLSAKAEQNNANILQRIKALQEITEGINIILPHLTKKMARKKNSLIIKILLELLQGSVLVFFKPKYKKLLLGIKLGLAVAKDLSKR